MRILITILLLISPALVIAENLSVKDGSIIGTEVKEVALDPKEVSNSCLSKYSTEISKLESEIDLKINELHSLEAAQAKCLTVAGDLQKIADKKQIPIGINWSDVRVFAGVNWSDNSVINP